MRCIPDDENSGFDRPDKLHNSPPAFHTRTIYDQNAFPDGQRAMIPDQEKVENGIDRPADRETACA